MSSSHQPNAHLRAVIGSSASSVRDECCNCISDTSHDTELDSHANMVVVCKHALVTAHTGKTVEVQPFSPDCQTMTSVPIVDAVIKWTCPHTDETCLLLMKNALHVPSMSHNLIPPFVMREFGTRVNDVPKIHCEDPTEEDHSLHFKENDLRMPLQLNGIFSHFQCETPTEEDIENYDETKVLFLTPEGVWDPNSDVHVANKVKMMDSKGKMKPEKE